jgi:hypothetical protein
MSDGFGYAARLEHLDIGEILFDQGAEAHAIQAVLADNKYSGHRASPPHSA